MQKIYIIIIIIVSVFYWIWSHVLITGGSELYRDVSDTFFRKLLNFYLNLKTVWVPFFSHKDSSSKHVLYVLVHEISEKKKSVIIS